MNSLHFLDKFMGAICNLFDAYSSVLFLKDRGNRYKIASYFSLGDKININVEVTENSGIIGWIIKTDKTLIINDFSREKRRLCYYLKGEEQHIKSFMGIPLPGKKGVLCIDSKKSYVFTTKHEKNFIFLGELIAKYVEEKRRLIERENIENYYNALKLILSLKERFPKWDEYLKELLKVLKEYTGFKYCIFASRDERGTGYYLEKTNEPIRGFKNIIGKKFDINEGLVGWVFKNNRAIILSCDNEKKNLYNILGKRLSGDEFRSIVCLPLIVSQKTRGVFIFLDHEQKEITGPLSDFFKMLVEYKSVFLENLYHKNKLKRKNKV